MKQTTSDNLTAFISGLLLFVLLFVGFEANGTESKKSGSQQQQQQQIDAKTNINNSEHNPTATINIGTSGGAGTQSAEGSQGALSSNASNDGVNASDNSVSNVENNSSNVVLVPNNNTESCVRVWGFAWGDGGKSGALGVPWRSKKCDYEQAADDAFAAGERELGWFWKCENSSLYKSFKSKKESAESAKADCYAKMVGAVTDAKTIGSLREELKSMRNEQLIERQNCSDSKGRITQAWKDSCGAK